MENDCLTPPVLGSMGVKASWCNWYGRVDRAACLEVSAGEVWRLVREWEKAKGKGKSAKVRVRGYVGVDAKTQALTGAKEEKKVSLSLEAVGDFVLTLDFVLRLHAKRLPRRLSGDLRSGKSVAMRPAPGSPEGNWRERQRKRGKKMSVDLEHARAMQKRRVEGRYPPRLHEDKVLYLSNAPRVRKRRSDAKRQARPRLLDHVLTDGLLGNPNCGATRTKAVDLPENWRQWVRVERHRLHAKLAQHFLVCPACGKKTVKLFFPQATREELADAAAARAWLKEAMGRFWESAKCKVQGAKLGTEKGWEVVLEAVGEAKTPFGSEPQGRRQALAGAVGAEFGQVLAEWSGLLRRRFGFLMSDPDDGRLSRRMMCARCWGLRYGWARERKI